MSTKSENKGPDGHRLRPEELRWRCDPARFAFETTADIAECPINIIGQPRAQSALELGLASRSEGYNIFVTGDVGSGRSTVVKRMLAAVERGTAAPDDFVYVHNFKDPDQPVLLRFRAGRGKVFRQVMTELIESLRRDLAGLFESDDYRRRKAEQIDSASAGQKTELKGFEKRVQDEGFTLVQVQMGPYVRSQLVPVVAGNPVDMDHLDSLVEEGKYKREDLDELQKKQTELKAELEGLSKVMRNLERDLRRTLGEMDRELARPLIEERVTEIRDAFAPEELKTYLKELTEDILENLGDFRDEAAPEAEPPADRGLPPTPFRYHVNVMVDNAGVSGRPVIWETTPSYRNLFGIVERSRSESGEWETDHTRIKAGALLRADGGFLVLDAMDLLVEPGVWAALKRTLRHRQVEVQSIDVAFLIGGASLKPEPVPIDVKVIIIGTRYIYRMLYALDEDFKKIFKVKAEFAMQTALNEDELMNYACLVHKRCQDETLAPFHRDAVSAIVEQGVRMAGNNAKMTTRFSEVVDLIREAGYAARQSDATVVRAEHVDQALRQRIHRHDLLEEMLRERIDEGTVLIDLQGERVGQVNGLAVLDQGDYAFALPSRITATTAMGRAGIIDVEREAAMSGSTHTKGILILTGFLRERFAQLKPLTLTASVVFEQNYGGIDGDSASSTELYALLSSLADVPIRQGIAVTGSVNQRGEVQPIGGVNEKVEGFFDLCRLKGLSGEQGVMIPARNQSQLMLRKDVVQAVADGRFRIFAVSTIEEGLAVLTGKEAGSRKSPDEDFAPESIFGRADAKLTRLAEQVARFGPADAGSSA